MKEPLAYTTTVMSWNFLLSAFQRAEAAGSKNGNLDLNLEAPPSIVLCCISIEAFCNEISSLSRAFLFDQNRETNPSEEDLAGIAQEKLSNLCDISQDSKGSFYDRYKRVVRLLGENNPGFMDELVHLRDLRDSLVHFRSCDVPITEGEDGVIRYAQDPPPVLRALKNRRISEKPVVAGAKDEDWTLRISTSAMAIWALLLTCQAILYVLDSFPEGSFRKFVLERYRPRDRSYTDLYSKAKDDISVWEHEVLA
ncbi:MAG: hypothetical protein LAT63_11400 [Marinobacter sp.]|nr:hypothetical protein [Marinobacter sp.]